MQSAQRVLIGGGAAYDCELGFVPDMIKGFTYNSTPDSIVYFDYQGPLAAANAVIIAGGGIYGWSLNGAVIAELTADTGFIPLEGSKTPRVLVESPKPGTGLIATTVLDWAAGTSYSTGERSATAIGTIVRPPIHNGYVFELTTDTGNGTGEPSSWDVSPGETVTDDGSNIWTCREENITGGGEPGITLGATLMTDSNTVIFYAQKFDSVKDLGDIG